MSYPKAIDEYSDIELQDELKRREQCYREGVCDYCGRSGDTEPCKFPSRHLCAAVEITVNDIVDERGIRYIGKASRSKGRA